MGICVPTRPWLALQDGGRGCGPLGPCLLDLQCGVEPMLRRLLLCALSDGHAAARALGLRLRGSRSGGEHSGLPTAHEETRREERGRAAHATCRLPPEDGVRGHCGVIRAALALVGEHGKGMPELSERFVVTSLVRVRLQCLSVIGLADGVRRRRAVGADDVVQVILIPRRQHRTASAVCRSCLHFACSFPDTAFNQRGFSSSSLRTVIVLSGAGLPPPLGRGRRRPGDVRR